MWWVADWLGFTVYDVERAVEGWQRMSDLLKLDALSARRLSRFVKDTSAHLHELMQVAVSLREQTVAFCGLYSLPLPEHMREGTPLVSVVVEG